MANVLLIEDDDTQRLVAAYALRKVGHEVREAADGIQGLTAARELPPDAIVCDVMMPGMNGYEVLTHLRRDTELATIPVVLLTAMSDRQHMRQGMVAGADDYLTKPYKPSELCDAVAAVLTRRQAQEEAFRSSLSGMVESALEQQKETLGRQYENKLHDEINARWSSASAATDLHYADAMVLLADLLGAAAPGSESALAERVKQAQQAARDTLALFGATHVIPYGAKLLAVFSAEQASVTTPAALRALRAAIGIAKAGGRDRPTTVALHTGPVALVAVNDALHGDQGHALVPGEAVNAVDALQQAAARAGWRIAASEAMLRALDGQAAIGRREKTVRGDMAVEVTGLGAS
ncbi:MAG TPA: response regulator [Ramlibacter sp.]|nr:response regulator [Ramlibacter sp.]